MAVAVNISYRTDALSHIGRICTIETAVRQNTKAEPYLLWDLQPVKTAKERRDVLAVIAELEFQKGANNPSLQVTHHI